MFVQPHTPFEPVKVLILEDNASMREILWSFLSGFGCRTRVSCSNVGDALDRLPTVRPDLAVVDYMLEKSTGIDFVQRLRRSSDFVTATTPVVVVTAHTQLGRIKEIINAGADEILAKPVRADRFYQRIANIVNARRQFVRIGDYFGPDRRQLIQSNSSERRRNSDAAGGEECVDID